MSLFPTILTESGNQGPTIDPIFIITDTISTDQDNYNPTGFETSGVISVSHIFLDVTADMEMTGVKAPDPQVYSVITIMNVGSKKLKIKKNNANSDVVNRFDFKGDVTIDKKESITIVYYPTTSKWCRQSSKN